MAFHYPDHGLAMDPSSAAASSPNPSFSPGGGGGAGVGGGEREKAAVAAHPLSARLLAAPVACLRVATPVAQLPRLDEADSASARLPSQPPPTTDANGGPLRWRGARPLHVVVTHYVLLLCSFKEQLQQHVRVHAMEAVMGCWELEQSLQSLTGASPGEGTGATMSDDEDNQVDSEANMFDGNDGSDGMGFGPLMLTEGERSLVERVRHELKNELKQVAFCPLKCFIHHRSALFVNQNVLPVGVQRKACGY
ncbi:hypothetical protein OsI_06117 [Oryza sativa Indica Group]|uniref:KNOX1 domain-containing protein n=1 Tax=Oryza sativa subsp. indica TaxID=39946 RepID=B8AIX3_ORYSI|nr:hypothetical protein OsI_06117 [Oryza sativa Indica Group]